MTCDVEFLAVVNDALSGAHFDALVLVKFEGSLELSTQQHRYRISWTGWLSKTPGTTVSSETKGYLFAPVIGPMIGERLMEIRHEAGVYELIFSEGKSVFAGHFSDEKVADHILMVTAIGGDAPFTWGLLD